MMPDVAGHKYLFQKKTLVCNFTAAIFTRCNIFFRWAIVLGDTLTRFCLTLLSKWLTLVQSNLQLVELVIKLELGRF